MTEKGMTLLEVLLALVLSSLFFAMLVPLFGQTLSMVNEQKHLSNEQMEFQTVFYGIQDEIRTARAIGVWVHEASDTGWSKEIYHHTELLVQGETYDLTKIVLQTPIGDPRVFQLHNQSKEFLYQSQVLIDQVDRVTVERIDHHVTLNFIREDKLGIRSYPFRVENGYKLEIDVIYR